MTCGTIYQEDGGRTMTWAGKKERILTVAISYKPYGVLTPEIMECQRFEVLKELKRRHMHLQLLNICT